MSAVFDSPAEVHTLKLDLLYRRAVKLILPGATLTTEMKVKQLSNFFHSSRSFSSVRVYSRCRPSRQTDRWRERGLG